VARSGDRPHSERHDYLDPTPSQAGDLARPRLGKYLSADQALRFLTDLAGQTTLLTDPPPPHPAVCRDPDDDYLVALATASHADAIIIGDDDLLAIDRQQLAIDILTPRQLVDRLG
jgi:predicted nucleic acid-binding protein